jgi:hypothetical protein
LADSIHSDTCTGQRSTCSRSLSDGSTGCAARYSWQIASSRCHCGAPWPQDLPRERHRLVEPGAALGRERHADELPPLFLGCFGGPGRTDSDLQRPDRIGLRARHPLLFVLAAGQGQHCLGLARAHLTAPDCLAEQRARSQLHRQPRHGLRGAASHPQALAGVVADAGVAELEHPVALGEPRQGRADRDIERPAAARHAREERVDEVGRLGPQDRLLLVGGGRLELPGRVSEGVEGPRRRPLRRGDSKLAVALAHAQFDTTRL